MIDFSDQQMKDIFSRYGAQTAYLYGSHAKGNASSLSDIDLAVLLRFEEELEKRFSKRLLLAQEIMAVLGTSHVDLVVLNDTPPALAYRVISEGKVLFCQDQSLRARFEHKVLQGYLDTEFLRRIYNRELFKNIANGMLR